ncbi:hypothetical protein WG954_09130 [Lacibacter sp. H375]|uniref:hypothetical protein n=1 Tax=Lacibacter sp. H375 TaxID=3133424 RepID=UPI0030C17173
MKYLAPLFLGILFLASCKKDNGIPETLPFQTSESSKIISFDTLITGQWWGLNIGGNSTDIYRIIQDIQTEKQINYLGIVGNTYTKIEDLESSIPLYKSIFLDQKDGSNNGIQIYFASSKVSSIWTNGGIQLHKWPSNTSVASTIAKNDTIEKIHAKLTNIKQMEAYNKMFERVSLFFKDINKNFDAQMSKSPQWHFSSTVNEKRFYIVQLNFISGTLSSIYVTLNEKL